MQVESVDSTFLSRYGLPRFSRQPGKDATDDARFLPQRVQAAFSLAAGLIRTGSANAAILLPDSKVPGAVVACASVERPRILALDAAGEERDAVPAIPFRGSAGQSASDAVDGILQTMSAVAEQAPVIFLHGTKSQLFAMMLSDPGQRAALVAALAPHATVAAASKPGAGPVVSTPARVAPAVVRDSVLEGSATAALARSAARPAAAAGPAGGALAGLAQARQTVAAPTRVPVPTVRAAAAGPGKSGATAAGGPGSSSSIAPARAARASAPAGSLTSAAAGGAGAGAAAATAALKPREAVAEPAILSALRRLSSLVAAASSKAPGGHLSIGCDVTSALTLLLQPRSGSSASASAKVQLPAGVSFRRSDGAVSLIMRDLASAAAASAGAAGAGAAGAGGAAGGLDVQALPVADPHFLATALRCVYEDGADPFFSLDPADPRNPDGPLVKKVFRPAWLAGTPFGETLFAADWALKQHALGLWNADKDGKGGAFKSALDLGAEQWREHLQKSQPLVTTAGAPSTAVPAAPPTRHARVWFSIQSLAVQLSAGAADAQLQLPSGDSCVRLRVDARETRPDPKSPTGLADLPVSDPSAPAVRFADLANAEVDAFVRCLPIYGRLREMAACLAVAKALHALGVPVSRSFMRLWTAPVASTPPCLLVPACKAVREWTETATVAAGPGGSSGGTVTRTASFVMTGGITMASELSWLPTAAPVSTAAAASSSGDRRSSSAATPAAVTRPAARASAVAVGGAGAASAVTITDDSDAATVTCDHHDYAASGRSTPLSLGRSSPGTAPWSLQQGSHVVQSEFFASPPSPVAVHELAAAPRAAAAKPTPGTSASGGAGASAPRMSLATVGKPSSGLAGNRDELSAASPFVPFPGALQARSCFGCGKRLLWNTVLVEDCSAGSSATYCTRPACVGSRMHAAWRAWQEVGGGAASSASPAAARNPRHSMPVSRSAALAGVPVPVPGGGTRTVSPADIAVSSVPQCYACGARFTAGISYLTLATEEVGLVCLHDPRQAKAAVAGKAAASGAACLACQVSGCGRSLVHTKGAAAGGNAAMPRLRICRGMLMCRRHAAHEDGLDEGCGGCGAELWQAPGKGARAASSKEGDDDGDDDAGADFAYITLADGSKRHAVCFACDGCRKPITGSYYGGASSAGKGTSSYRCSACGPPPAAAAAGAAVRV